MIEFAAIVADVLLDLFISTLVIFGLRVISLLIRREHIAGVGFKRPQSWLGMAGLPCVIIIFMQLFDVGVVMPIMNRLNGTTIDYSGFASLQGNLGQPLLLLVLTWTLAAVGEELAYRGDLQKVLGDRFGSSLTGVLSWINNRLINPGATLSKVWQKTILGIGFLGSDL